MQKRLKSEFLSKEEFCADKEISALIGDENSNTVRHSLMLKIMNNIIENDLTDRQKQMITMYYFQHMNISEIAGKLGVNRSTVSRTISRGRKNLTEKNEVFCYLIRVTDLLLITRILQGLAPIYILNNSEFIGVFGTCNL